MKKVYYSAAVKLNNDVNPVIGVCMQDKDYSFDEAKKNFEFLVYRYFGDVKRIIAFGKVTKKDFDLNTNIQISDF